MSKPVNRRRYTGELAAPIIRPAPPTFEGAVTDERLQQFWDSAERHWHEADDLVAQKLREKMSLLMAHYGIADETNLAALACALASEHVPGFRIEPETKTERGRKRIWDGPKLQNLFEAVRSVREGHNLNDRQALTLLVNSHAPNSPWRPPSNHKGTKQQWIETLESRLQDAKQYINFLESLPDTLAELREKFRE
jgi:hypothetical protein